MLMYIIQAEWIFCSFIWVKLVAGTWQWPYGHSLLPFLGQLDQKPCQAAKTLESPAFHYLGPQPGRAQAQGMVTARQTSSGAERLRTSFEHM